MEILSASHGRPVRHRPGCAAPLPRCGGAPWLRLRLILFVLGLSGSASLWGQADEYQVKAFFLYNFARYVEWPAETFKSAADPIAICVLGQNPFGGALEQAISGKEVGGRSLVARQISDIQPRCNCQILFVNAAESRRFRSAAEALRGSGVLTVGESPRFASGGGVINFVLVDRKVRFEINLVEAGQTRLRISSKLLSLAQIVKR